MTISLLAFDVNSGTFGGAATTGSLCVGGWVLRGDVRSGLSASQGSSPSTLWGEDALSLMGTGLSARDTVARLTKDDPGRSHRQLSVLDGTGGTASFTGADSIAYAGALDADCLVVSGNMLVSAKVLTAARDGYREGHGPMAVRLLSGLRAAAAAGGDLRGLKSAALLQLHADHAPLSLRIDYAENPLEAMQALYDRATSQPYVSWTEVVPTRNDPYRSKTA
ncbi:DUF1028 domain-containing protein [Roseobacter sinensis]|uniref:DUF1028 domain-containing protein n=1 Tax=Roseobacter sinensis TaxID=2931391 RepID=A0ABT3BE21_9RHOB|nr:DUF1028 domain-containing protein [Roseobacter sp. WL0113]MCV3271822.1 DUF1028 domain-containing protein [Roseobacter sp. WL0113]